MQIAKVFGAHVTGVCSTSKVELVRSIGADEVIDYTRTSGRPDDQDALPRVHLLDVADALERRAPGGR